MTSTSKPQSSLSPPGAMCTRFMKPLVCASLAALLSLMLGRPAHLLAQEEPAQVTPAGPQDQQPETSRETEPAADAGTGAEETEPAPPPPFILDPYRVDVRISFTTDPSFSKNARERLVADVEKQLASQFRQMWSLRTSAATGTGRLTPRQLSGLTAEAAGAPDADSEFDKVLLATLEQRAGRYVVLAREWDRSSGTLGSLHRMETYDRRLLASRVAEALAEAFRPLAELEVLDDETIEFLIRAGEFPPRDDAVRQFQPGDYLVPYMRYLDRNRSLRQIQPVPWTYLKVEEITRSRMRLSMTSAFRAPLPTARRRVEVMAMRIRPHLPATEIRIYPHGNPRNPLVGYRCEVLDRLPTDEDPVEERLKLSTDRRGIVTVPVNPEQPLQHLLVHSGKALLARVPFIPGDAPLLDVEVPDDRARLNVEGEVALLQGELIDIVATREVLMARARSAANQEKWDAVDGFIKSLEAIPTLQQFQGRIDTLRVQAVYQAQQAGDRVAQSRIEQLCSGISTSAEKHLDRFRIPEFIREVNSLRPR